MCGSILVDSERKTLVETEHESRKAVCVFKEDKNVKVLHIGMATVVAAIASVYDLLQVFHNMHNIIWITSFVILAHVRPQIKIPCLQSKSSVSSIYCLCKSHAIKVS